MEPFRHHLYVCEQRKPDGAPCCHGRGSAAVIEALRRELGVQGLAEEVQITTCGSLGLCERGPNLVVYPEGIWYSGVTPADVPELVREHLREGRPVERLVNRDAAALHTEIAANRDRAMAAMRARQAMGGLPDEIQGPARAFQESRILLSAVELDLFTPVGGGATAAAVAEARQTDLRATEIVLNALAAMGLLEKERASYRCGPAAARFLVRGAPDDASTGLRHQLNLWNTWSQLSECLRTGQPGRQLAMGDRGDDWTIPFIAAMHRNASSRAPQILQAVGAAGVRRMLDVGGGSGAYAIAFAAANPELRAEIFDLETVVPIAQSHVAQAGLTGRVGTRVGDLRRDALGSGYDLVLLSAICHMLGPEENQDLFGRARAALAPGGRLVVQDFILNEEKTAPGVGAIFAVNMLVGTPGGATYSEAEYAGWLGQAGLGGVRRVKLPGVTDLMIGQRT